MTKTIKMSLVAAVAVAGLSTTASAAGHEKSPFEFSGFVSYTVEKTTAKTGDDAEAQRDLDIRVNAKAKINNEWTANVRVDEANDDDTDNTGTATLANKNVDSSSLTLQVDRANLNYNTNGTSVTFGMVQVPLSDGGQGDGIIAKQKIGASTLVSGYLYTIGNGSVDKSSELAFAGVHGKIEELGYNVIVASVMDSATLSDDQTVIAVDLNAKVGIAKVGLNYASNSSDAADYKQTKLSVGTNLGKVNVSAAYAVNSDDGGKAMINGSDEGKANILLGKTDLSSTGDKSSAYLLSVSAKIDTKNSVKVAYAAISKDKDDTVEESTVLLKISHQAAKNLGLFANYEINSENDAKTELTLGAKYSF